MKQFDIFYCQPPDWPEPHPCVIVSHPDRAEGGDPVELVRCSTQRTKRGPRPHEVLLDEADGLDWPTLCKCDLIFAAPRSELKRYKGTVCETRQGPLLRQIIAAHGWGTVLAKF